MDLEWHWAKQKWASISGYTAFQALLPCFLCADIDRAQDDLLQIFLKERQTST
jgi:hypothetical protein